MKTTRYLLTMTTTAVFCSPLALFAQEAAGPLAAGTTLRGVVDTIIFGLIGILLAVLGYKVFDKVTPFDLGKELAEDQNIAAAIVVGAMILGVSLIVGLTIMAP